MPLLEEIDVTDIALLWPANGIDSYGQPSHDFTMGAVQEIKVLWNGGKKTSIDANGNPIAIDATVAVLVDVPLGSLMWEGGLKDLPGTSEVPEADIMKVVGFNSSDDLKGRSTRRELALVRYRDTLAS